MVSSHWTTNYHDILKKIQFTRGKKKTTNKQVCYLKIDSGESYNKY